VTKNIVILFLLSAGSFCPLFGQYYSTGQDPASIRWSRIKTDSFQIIFPKGFEYNARYLANILKLTTKFETKSLKTKVPRMPFIIHSHSIRSNAVSIWAPRRIEFYPCPPQDSYAEEWLEQLALHEYRHAVQVSKMNRGFTRVLYYLFGEQAPGAVLGLFLPGWFMEGDATVMETALSNSGRGRVASFQSPLRAQLLQKGIYSYDKATLGSYKTFTPDEYTLGYHLVGKGREQYGYELWDHALDKVGKLPFMVVPFNAGIKQKTGLWKTGFYRKMMEELLITWQQQEDSTWRSSFTPVTKPDPSDYATYVRPQFLNDSSIVAFRYSNEKVQRLVVLDPTGKEKILLQTGAYPIGSISVTGNHIVWTEYRSDVRWGNQSYSVIRSYDIRTGRLRYLTMKSRYFSPALTPDGSRLLTVRITEENRSFIDILETGNGKVLHSIPAPDNGLFLQPSWSPDGKKIAFILLTRQGKSLQVVAPESHQTTTYLNPTFREISAPPLFYRNYLLFSADYTGIENLYAIDTLTRQIYQVTSTRFQATDPAVSPNGNMLIYSDYCADGMMVVTREADSNLWIPLDSIYEQPFPLAEAMARQEGVNIQDSMMCDTRYAIPDPGSDYPVTKYSKIRHLFNIHSWAPFSMDANNLSIHPGVSVMSQNLLSTAFATAGYDYDLNERTGKFYLDFSYQGWFPVIDFRYSFGKRAGTGRYSQTGETFRYTWNESNMRAYVRIPLNLTRGIWYRSIQPQVGTSWIYVIHDKTTPAKFTSGSVNTVDYRVYAYNYIRSNYQDMFPKWGQNLNVVYQHTPFGSNNMGSIFGIATNLYFPGILRHHGIRIYGGFQQRWDRLVYGYQFSNVIAYPRGITSAYNEYLVSLLSNYKFPFFRIDASLGSVLYIKRFKLNLFYDWANGWGIYGDNIYQSTGFELTSELHILRFFTPLELGVQGAYLPNDNRWVWRFLWGVNF